MIYCPDCNLVLESGAGDREAGGNTTRCGRCEADMPASGWPDDGVPLNHAQPPASWPHQELSLDLRDDDRRHYVPADATSSSPTLLLLRHAPSELLTSLRSAATTGLGGVKAAGALGGEDGAAARWTWAAVAGSSRNLRQLLKERGGTLPADEACALGASLVGQLGDAAEHNLNIAAVEPERIAFDVDGDTSPPILPLAAVQYLRTGVPPADSSGSATPSRWAAPEVADGQRPDNDSWLYSLGLVLYAALAGEHPLSGLGLRERLRRQAAGEIPPLPDAVAERLPPGLQGTVLDMLEPRPANRPQPADVVRKLRAFASGRLLKVDQSPSLKDSTDASDDGSGARDEGKMAGTGGPGARPESGSSKSGRSKSTTGSAGRGVVSETQQSNRGSGPPPLSGGGPGMFWSAAGIALVSLILAWFLIQGAPVEDVTGGGAAADNITVQSEKIFQPMSMVSPPEDCASCHPNHVMEWERSVMAHSARSPLYNALDMAIQEQFGRSNDCPNGAGALRKANPNTACRDQTTGFSLTGTGGEHWCVNCHVPLERRLGEMQAWSGLGFGFNQTRVPMPSQLSKTAMEGITCTFCHQVTGPAANLPGQDGYVGNDTWRSPFTGTLFSFRTPQDAPGIANSGYYHDPNYMFDGQLHPESPARVHGVGDPAAMEYLQSSEFCGSCHDVRLFGTDAIGNAKGENFKRLRNAYSEWLDWKEQRQARGAEVYSCQDCHMSLFPGTCDPNGSGGEEHGCPEGTGFVPVEPGAKATGGASTTSLVDSDRSPHYFSGVDVPLTPVFDQRWSTEKTLDTAGIPLGVEERRDMLLKNTFRFEISDPSVRDGSQGAFFDGRRLQIPITIENVNAGHRVPAGFSQEREFWVHLTVKDAQGRLVYEVGRVDRDDEDLRDKIFLQINANPDIVNAQGQPVGLFGADVADGPDVPEWTPPPELGGASRFRGKGLINFQNGFLRCVRCIGVIGADGSCQALPGQEETRAARFEDGEYDVDTGACDSNLSGFDKFFEVYFPLGSLDASRGLIKGPDAIIDTRSLPGDTPVTYVYDLNAAGFEPPFTVQASLNFRAFPPFLIRGFAQYEQFQSAKGLRPDGPLITFGALDKLHVVELETAETLVSSP